jgi:hypothetical protein
MGDRCALDLFEQCLEAGFDHRAEIIGDRVAPDLQPQERQGDGKDRRDAHGDPGLDPHRAAPAQGLEGRQRSKVDGSKGGR